MDKDYQKQIIFKLIMQPLQKELTPVAQTIQHLAEQYSFLFNDDVLETKNNLLFSLSQFHQNILDDGVANIDKEYLFNKIDDTSKERLLMALMEKLSSQCDVSVYREMMVDSANKDDE